MLKIFKRKKVIIVSIMIMLTSVLMLSYASFVVTTNDYKASELLVSELTYSLSIYEGESNVPIENNTITIGANQTKIYNVVIRSINKIDSKYTLAYNSQEDLTVKYSNRTSWSTEDYIKDYNSNNTKNVRIVVENKSNEERQVEIKIFGGYRYNDYIKIDTKGYTRITEEYDEELLASSELLNEIIKEETKCESEPCLYGGGSKSNYLSYSNNLYRIIGTYTIGTDKVTKIITENITETSNIKEDLNKIYNNLEDKEEIIYKTNKFNCNETGCTEPTDYNNIGLLTKYEYEIVGGDNSYLKSNEGYYILNENNIETQNGSEIGGIKPIIYLPSRTRVTGSGTINDPYKILTSDINIIAYTYNGQETDIPYETLKETKAVSGITCDKGTKATWDGINKKIIFENVQVPEYCTVDFKDTYTVTISVQNGTVTNTNPAKVTPGKTAEFLITPLSFKNIGSYIECTGLAEKENFAGGVWIKNVNSDVNCTIKYGEKYTISTNGCLDKEQRYGISACAMIKEGYDPINPDKSFCYYGSSGNDSCKRCRLSSQKVYWGLSKDECTNELTDLRFLQWWPNENRWHYYGKSSYVSCEATIVCDN